MRSALLLRPFLIHNPLYCYLLISSIRLHNLYTLPNRELVSLLNTVHAVFFLFHNPKISILLYVSIVIIDLALLPGLSEIKSCRKLPVGTV